jgi:hypothetical protein
MKSILYFLLMLLIVWSLANFETAFGIFMILVAILCIGHGICEAIDDRKLNKKP